MKTIVALISFALAQHAFGGIIREPILASTEMLRARGVQVSKTVTRGIIVSVDVDASVTRVSGEESFEAMEFVVYNEEVSDEGLGRRDSNRSQDASRRERKKDHEGRFSAIGKEMQKAYLVFEFLGPSDSPMSHYRRYIIPLRVVEEKEANKIITAQRASRVAD